MDWNRLPLSRTSLDRGAVHRSEPELLERSWADPSALVLVLDRGRPATRAAADGGVELDLRSPAELGHLRREGDLLLYLGEAPPDGPPEVGTPRPYLALVLADQAASTGNAVGIEGVPELAAPLGSGRPFGWSALRDVGHVLGDRDAGLATTAVGLAAWHERNPRCPRCGAPTVPAQGGWVRRCTVEGTDHYPRTDPAVIMAVVDPADRLLLGHAAHWPERRFSTLAGYVEPGESLEGAVRREVGEEVGVVIGDVVYRGSQPWPFPASLMLAFVARAETTRLTVDGDEITDARWFTRDDLRTAVGRREVLLPMRTSVARALIEDWLGQRLESPDW